MHYYSQTHPHQALLSLSTETVILPRTFLSRLWQTSHGCGKQNISHGRVRNDKQDRSRLYSIFFFFRKHRQFFWSFCRKHVVSTSIDVSKSAQLRDIESSFVAQNDGFVLDQLQHPNKLNVTAVESYPILPDIDIWANQYDLFRFSERPGERPVDVSNVLRFLSEVQTAFFGNKDRRSTTGLCHSKAHENGPRFFPRILSHSG